MSVCTYMISSPLVTGAQSLPLRGWGEWMRISLALAIACLTTSGFSAASEAQAAIRKPTNIPPQTLRPALYSLSEEHDLQIVFRTDVVADLKTQGASGDLTLDEALSELLNGTELTYKYLDDKTVTIVP